MALLTSAIDVHKTAKKSVLKCIADCRLLKTFRWCVSKWVRFNVTTRLISWTAFAGKIAHTHNNGTVSLTLKQW